MFLFFLISFSQSETRYVGYSQFLSLACNTSCECQIIQALNMRQINANGLCLILRLGVFFGYILLKLLSFAFVRFMRLTLSLLPSNFD